MTDINTIMSSSFVRVKLVALVHFLFIGNAMLGTWLPGAFIFYNFLFMISLLWMIHCKESVDAAHTAVVINSASIFFDLICIIIFFGLMNGWVIAFAIINLILRPFTLILLYREFTERGGNLSSATIFPTNQQRSYQDIDRPTQTVPTNSDHMLRNVQTIS